MWCSILFVVLLAILIGFLRVHWLAIPNVVPSEPWCTIVGLKADSDESLLLTLQSRHLILKADRSIEEADSFLNELMAKEMVIGAKWTRLVMAVYKKDPYLNWRGPDLLHQGYLSISTVRLLLPLYPLPVDPLHTSAMLLIKPDGMRWFEAIKGHLEAEFTIHSIEHVILTRGKVERMYSHLLERPFFEEIVASLVDNGACVYFLLSAKDCIGRLRRLVGPTDPLDARKSSAKSLRALYGTDLTCNAVHASDSVESLVRDLSALQS